MNSFCTWTWKRNFASIRHLGPLVLVYIINMEIIFSIIVIRSSKKVYFVFNQNAIVSSSWRKIEIITRLYFFPFCNNLILKIFVTLLKFLFLILLIYVWIGHSYRNKRLMNHISSYNIILYIFLYACCTTDTLNLMEILAML